MFRSQTLQPNAHHSVNEDVLHSVSSFGYLYCSSPPWSRGQASISQFRLTPCVKCTTSGLQHPPRLFPSSGQNTASCFRQSAVLEHCTILPEYLQVVPYTHSKVSPTRKQHSTLNRSHLPLRICYSSASGVNMADTTLCAASSYPAGTTAATAAMTTAILHRAAACRGMQARCHCCGCLVPTVSPASSSIGIMLRGARTASVCGSYSKRSASHTQVSTCLGGASSRMHLV